MIGSGTGVGPKAGVGVPPPAKDTVQGGVEGETPVDGTGVPVEDEAVLVAEAVAQEGDSDRVVAYGEIARGAEMPIVPPTATGISRVSATHSDDRYISHRQVLPSLARGRVLSFPDTTASTPAAGFSVPLRDYQDEFVRRAMDRYEMGQDRGLLVLPSGAGKTLSAVALAARLGEQWRDLRGWQQLASEDGFVPANWRKLTSFLSSQTRPEGILFVSHRDFLISQAQLVFSQVFGPENVGIFQGGVRQTDRKILIASAQTLAQNMADPPIDRYGLLILDEAHHYVPENVWSDILRKMGFIGKDGNIQGAWPRLMIGLTATPDRLEGTPLINVYGPEGLLLAVDAQELWQRPDRVLLKPQAIGLTLDKPIDTLSGAAIGDIVADLFYSKLNWGDKFHHTLVYLNAVSQIEGVVDKLNGLSINTAGLSGETPVDERDRILRQFKDGTVRVLVNVAVAGEGFDVPSVETIVLVFESESRTRVVQAIGRAMRVDKGSSEKVAWVVDIGGNLARHRLDIQTQEAYEVLGPTLVRKARDDDKPAKEKPRNPSEHGGLVGTAAVGLGGMRPVTSEIQDVFTRLNVKASEIQAAAYRLGIPADEVFAYANGLTVPASLSDVLLLAPEIGDQFGLLHEAWARERAAQTDIAEPLPATLSSEEKAVAEYLRFALWYKYEGVITRIAGTEAGTVRGWLDGKWESFRAVTVEIWPKRIQKVLVSFEIADREDELMELVNKLLISHGYPRFEEWMKVATKEQILIFRLKELAEKLGRSPTANDVDAESGMGSSGTYRNTFGSFNAALEAAGLEANKRIRTREELIADLKKLAKKLGRSPTQNEVNTEPGMGSSGTYYNIFGSFNAALEAAGLGVNQKSWTREELIVDLQGLARRLERTPTIDEVNAEPGMASSWMYRKIFGSFNAALEAAGFKVNQKIRTREELIADLQGLAKKLGRTPTTDEVKTESGVASISTYQDIFGSFNAALEAAGLGVNKKNWTREGLITDLQMLAKKFGRSPTQNEVNAESGIASDQTYKKAFGSFNAALEAAGLGVNHKRYTRAELIADLKKIAKRLGRSPTQNEVNAEPSMGSSGTYHNTFGSFNAALEAAGLSTRKSGGQPSKL